MLSFDDIGKEVLVSSFYMNARTADAVQFEGAKVLHGQFVKYLQGRDSMSAMTGRAQDSFEAQLSQLRLPCPPSDPVPLFSTLSSVVFKATMSSLFGPDHPLVSESSYEDFAAHDANFPFLAGGAPSFLFPSSSSGSAGLRSKVVSSVGDVKGLMDARDSYFKEINLSPSDRAAAQAVIVWASAANTVPTAVWTLAHIASSPSSLSSVRRELSALSAVDDMPYLDSCVHETFRLKSSSMTVRKVTSPVGVTLPGGARLRGGDRVAIFPPLQHMDPRNFEEPETWKGGRFVDEPGKKNLVMPFGGGASKCPGRLFALREVKVFIRAVLTEFDVEVVGELPEFDKTRVGLGINGVEKGKDVMCRLRRRVGKRE